MPTTREKIREILTSDAFSDGEKFVVRAQYRETIPMSNFEDKLFAVLCAADESNFKRLALGFPAEARGVTAWHSGDLGKRLRAVGLDIQAMRVAPICPLPDFFVSHEDNKKRYVEVNFEKRADALAYMKKLQRRRIECELWTRTRVHPEAR